MNDYIEIEEISEREENDLVRLLIKSKIEESKARAKRKARIKFIKEKMIPYWGMWASGDDTTSQSSMSKAVQAQDYLAIKDPHESGGLSGYLSDMLYIDEAVSKLNRHYQELIRAEFIHNYVDQVSGHVYSHKERVRWWCGEFGVNQDAYRKVKSNAVAKIVKTVMGEA